MIITNAKQTETETWVFDLHLTNDEIDYLVNLAIHLLLQTNIISITEQKEAQEIPLFKQTHASSNMVN